MQLIVKNRAGPSRADRQIEKKQIPKAKSQRPIQKTNFQLTSTIQMNVII